MIAPQLEGTRGVPFLDLGSMTEDVASEVLTGWSGLLDSGAFIGGEAVTRFEDELARFCGVPHAVGVANGTDALHLAFRALGVGAGDQVIVPANTFVATVEAIVLAGAEPRFADVDPETLLLTADTMRAAHTPRCRAVVVVHLYGQMADMGAIAATAAELDLLMVEDAAQAHGASWGHELAGSVGAAGCFSFYPGKNLGAFGDAGAVVTHDAAVADKVRCMRDHGRVSGSHYEHRLLGMNSRLDAVQAVVLSAKLRRLAEWNAARRQIMQVYREVLEPEAATLVTEYARGCGVYHLAVARVMDRERLRADLADLGIATGVHYPTPCHLMEPYRRYSSEQLPAAEAAATEILSLPIWPHMQVSDVERVGTAVNHLARRRSS
jgi:dTDP-4-amino-4,6-dideoxygalactose transaminase